MTELSTASDVLRTIRDHPNRHLCPACGEDMRRVVLVNIVYTFEVCDCEVAPYKHLVETLYHRKCIARAAAEHSKVQP